MSSSAIQLVCFDLGGVLVRLVRGGWAGACAAAGLEMDAREPEGWPEHVKLLARLERGEVDEAEYLRELPGCLPGVRQEVVLAAFDAWLLGMYDGAEALIDELKRRGLKTACLSNTNERHWRALAGNDPRYAALAKLDYLIASHEIRAAKPALRAYQIAEEQMGFRGQEILFFDDRAENVEGARAAGWRAEQVDRVEDAVGQMREYLGRYRVL